jgi:mannosyltransferase OCH1-like enzyme
MSSEEVTLHKQQPDTILDSVPIPIRVPKNHDSNNIIIQKKIPKIIYICHKNLKCLNMTYKFWKRLNPTYEIKLFNDAMCEQFLLDQFSELHRSIFKFIPDGPIKSDFWRLCILYRFGGIYVDADIHPLIPLNNYLSLSSDFVTCITTSNGNFNPHFIAARKNDPILKGCIEEYIHFYNDCKQSYAYWDWSIVHMFNKFLSNVKTHYNKMPQSQVFTVNEKKYQLFFEMTTHHITDGNNKHVIDNIMTKLKPHGLHDYYCTFLNKRIFNTRYINYDPDEHKFKNHVVKNRNKNHNIIGFRFNVDLSKLSNMKQFK